MGLAETAELAVRISLKDNASAGIRGLQKNLGGLSGSVGRVGKGFGQIGAGLARAGLLVGGAAVTGIAGAAKAAVNFEDAFAGVKKTVNEADLAEAGLTFDALAKQFRDMATEIPISAVELAKIGEVAGALGVKAGDIEEFTKTVALLGETTNLTTDDAAEALGKVGTILDLSGKEFEDFADTLVNLGNQGASTESEIIEITKRFAAMGDQAGLSTDEILALSSAASSLGIEPEAAGGALSRIFANMSTEIANGTKKGKEFASVTGDSLDELRKRIDKGDALGILMDTLKGLQGLSRTEGASVLKALGITNQRDRNAILLMANNLEFVNEQLEIAKESEGALLKEAEKRFATTASKIQLLKNNLIETGIAVGTEMLPAIGRALDKAIGLLKDPAFKAEAVELGKDIGKFIDDIDWEKVKDGAMALKDAMKGAVDFTLLLVSALDKLPNEIKGAAVGFLALNKLSGGLLGSGVGNVLGGLTSGLGSRLPGVGKLFAQPVFVTNWPAGGLGGAGGAAAAGGGLLSTIMSTAGFLLILDGLSRLPTALESALDAFNNPSPQGRVDAAQTNLDNAAPWLQGSLFAPFIGPMQDWIDDLNTVLNPPRPPVPQGISPDERDELQETRSTLVKYGEAEAQRDQVNWAKITAKQEELKRQTAEVETASERTRASVDWARTSITARGTSDAVMIANTIRANRPILTVNVTTNTVVRGMQEAGVYSAAHVGAYNKATNLL